MATFLFIQPEEITKTTILGGNVDVDKYQFCIADAQVSVIEPLLGTELYDKIIADLEGAGLSGLYLTMYNEFVKPITKNEATANYIEISSYTLNNAGLYKRAPENAEVVDKDEAQYLSSKYHALAQKFVLRFNKWICKNSLPEYKTYQDEVNAQRIKVTSGWYFGEGIGLTEDELADQ
jgi:hypothetical protein